MSYSISLVDPVTLDPLELDEPHHMRGGTYDVVGTTDASLNITWNYAEILYRVLPERTVRTDEAENFGADRAMGGVRYLYGMTGAASIPVLQAAIERLGNDTNPDYWRACEGNVKRALVQLKTLAGMRPDGVWHGD